MSIAIATIIAAIVSAVVGITATAVSTTQNAQSVADTNQANLEAVRETNAANVEQANLAYKRSLPVQQIADMRNAGISLPAAMNKLTGGGQYQMPTLQSGSSQASQMDLSGIAQAAERLGNIPSNVMQSRMQDAQLDALRQEMTLRQEAAERDKEKHQFEMWQNLYGKDATLKIDALSNEIVQMAADKGISLDNIDSVDKLVRAFDLGNNVNWRSMPNIARSQVLDGVRLQAAENRANQQQANANRAALDAHELANFEKSLKKLDISEREQSLVYKLALLANAVSLSNNNVSQSDMDKLVREAGFESEKEANAAIKAAENLEAGHRKERARFRATRPELVEDIGDTISWMLDKINPFKGLISTGK